MNSTKRRVNLHIELQAHKILQTAGISKIPVSPEDVARCLGIDVEAAALGEDVSGVLVVQNGQGAIGYNALQSPVRQRFSVAHEIGHFVLHRKKHNLFIDKRYSVFWRDENSSTGESLDEIQANQFAAALLMPKDKLIEEIRKLEFDLADEEEASLTMLAGKFRVSTQAMSFRLANLGFTE